MSTKSSTSRSADRGAAAPLSADAERSAADAPVQSLTGIGTAGARVLAARGVRTLFDLATVLPSGLVDLRAPLVGEAILAHARAGKSPAAIRGVVEKAAIVPMRGRRAIRVALRSEGVLVELWWFFFAESARRLTGEIVVIGAPTIDPKRPHVARIVHPRTAATSEGRLEPLYSIPGIASGRIADALRAALEGGDALPDDLDPTGKPGFSQLLRATHVPQDPGEHMAARSELRARLAWAEAAWLIVRRVERERATEGARAIPLPRDEKTERAIVAAFGFELTSAQRRAIDVFARRLATDRPTRSLLSGDVGSGKTAVLLVTAAQAIANGAQVAILAPTTVLADQYARAVAPLVEAIGARVALLPRANDPRAKEVLARAAEGSLDVLVGTHALLSSRVRFARLGLAIVDEQHRLGVGQRLALVEKGDAPHLISVSATPIPRTLDLALRGEIETVHLDERPRGRPLPDTKLVARRDWPAVVKVIEAAVGNGDRAFVVCARIEESEDGGPGGPGALARAAELRKVFGKSRVALVHGGLDEEETRAALDDFRSGKAAVLVGTSLLEVGVDVPEATLLVVDGADRFGLAQLHQLRGRVGRGDRPSLCLLVHEDDVTRLAADRMAAVAAAKDGLEVARADLALRGSGDLDGARQSGEAAGLRWLDPLADEAIAREATTAMERVRFEPNGDQFAALRRVFARLDGAKVVAGTGKKHARRDAG